MDLRLSRSLNVGNVALEALTRSDAAASDLCLHAVAFFVFFAGAAGAWIVASDFISGDALRGGGTLCRVDSARLFELATLLALKLFFQFVDGGGGGAVVDGNWRLRRGG